VCDFFRVRKHWHVTGGNSDRCSLHCSRFGLLKLWRNSAIVAGNHAPRWLGLPCGGRDCGPKNSCCCGTLCRRQQLLLVVWQILGEVFSDSLWAHGQKTFSIRPASLRCLAEPAETVWCPKPHTHHPAARGQPHNPTRLPLD